jgi:hypothetical protein
MLLIEANCFLLDSTNIISENRSKGSMVLKGTFQRANEVNANSRIYRKPVLEREVNKLMPLVQENRLLGELDHPESEVVRLQNASHMITGLSWEGNDVIGECTLLNTPAGLTAQTLVRDGVKIGISSRGLGTLTDIGESVQEVNDDFDMRTFDLVADPSTKGAFPGLQESKNYLSEGRKVITSAKKKALSERAFVVGLKKMLGSRFDSPKKIVNESFQIQEMTPERMAKGIKRGLASRGEDPKQNKPIMPGEKKAPGHKRTMKQVSNIQNKAMKRGGADRLDRALQKDWKESVIAVLKNNTLEELKTRLLKSPKVQKARAERARFKPYGPDSGSPEDQAADVSIGKRKVSNAAKMASNSKTLHGEGSSGIKRLMRRKNAEIKKAKKTAVPRKADFAGRDISDRQPASVEKAARTSPKLAHAAKSSRDRQSANGFGEGRSTGSDQIATNSRVQRVMKHLKTTRPGEDHSGKQAQASRIAGKAWKRSKKTNTMKKIKGSDGEHDWDTQ